MVHRGHYWKQGFSFGLLITYLQISASDNYQLSVQCLQRILKLEYELPPRIVVSPEAHSLLAAMLVAAPEQRISIPQVGCSGLLQIC